MNCPACGGFMRRVKGKRTLEYFAVRGKLWVCGHSGYWKRNPVRGIKEGEMIPDRQDLMFPQFHEEYE